MAHREDHTRVVLLSLLLAGMAFALSQTVVSPALPEIQREFGATPTSAAWILTGYLLAAAVATPIVGKLGDLFGRGRVLTVVLLLFAVGSAVCALAPSLGVLVLGRIIQGVGGGIFPLAFGIIRETFPPERVATAIGGISATFGIGGGVGLVIAGLIVEALDASWLFWLGLMALPAAFAIHRYVPREETRKDARIDWIGAGLLSVALASLLYGLSKATGWGWGDPRVLGLILGGLGVAAFWVWVETKIDQPLVDMRVLKRRPVLLTNVAAVLIGFSMFASFLIIPQLAQTPEQHGYGFGASVTGAGLLMLPSTLVMLVAGPWAGRLAVRSSRFPLIIGTGLGAVAFGFYALFHSSEWEILAGGAVMGMGIGFAFSAMANLVVESVPREEVGVATGINTIMRSLGGALGAQLVATLLTSKTLPNSAIPAEAAFTDAFAVAAVASLLAMGAALAIPVIRRPAPQPVAAAAPATS
ncbi:MFS transporter [Solirubrobacter phytolaccae]|uniref:MFS transporter n=1 Tax=Solirubrobacter phytolaccae TaxID=1404360 RepID=A0A9X3NI72_9ACTN|nr:MFS transporter [Solirubrobacter phytolaccae]MDA0181722.1 MFS transporter [Solirubrobacter phytolaccae]